tara:strand:- start:649 stop:1170 length:522 start_codon:yes stop_codon:yes gene_type:complete
MKFPKRNIITDKKIIKFNRDYKQRICLKPSGLWYSCYDSWYNWMSEEIPDMLFKYIHKLNIKNNVLTDIRNKNKNKLLVIKTLKDFDLFTKNYKVKTYYKDKGIIKEFIFIDWIKVSNDFGGIEICPYLNKRRNILWYYGFDVASGCIWNLQSIIKNLEIIYEKKNDKYIKIN